MAGLPPHGRAARELFPPVEQADPDGYLCSGLALREDVILDAYRRGIFPWFSSGGLVHWFAPDPRLVMEPGRFHVSRSLAKQLRRGGFELDLDRDFRAVIRGCAAARGPARESTWISPDFVRAYSSLHDLGWAHSVEVRESGHLVGGMYGLALGGCFFGESMFSVRANASKIAFAALARQLDAWGFELIDCQAQTDHLVSLGARAEPREKFQLRLQRALKLPSRRGPWRFDSSLTW
jgi:leucyl/phenylalanyl-tRNA--protein transferase